MTSQVLADRYEITDTIGQGGMGIVYRARHLLMKRAVAIKMLHESLAANELMRKRFEQEAQAISALNHPNIMTVYDFGISESGKPYLVVELLEGETLDCVLNRSGPLPVESAISIFKQACAGLAHAHEKGVIHRDIKPSNFMLVTVGDKDDFVKIVDFGIAKLIQEGHKDAIGLTTTGEFMGSPLFMSPEQCAGLTVDGRSDMYSLGCVIYLALTGRAPFIAESIPQCLYKHVHQMPPSFSDANPDLDLPAALEAIVFKAMSKSPNDRFANMTDFKKALEAYGSDSALQALNASPSEISTPPHEQNLFSTTGNASSGTVNTASGITPVFPLAKRLQSLAGTIADWSPKTKAIILMTLTAAAGFLGWIAFLYCSPEQSFARYLNQGNSSFAHRHWGAAERAYTLAYRDAGNIRNGVHESSQALKSLFKTYLAQSDYDKVTALAVREGQYDQASSLLSQQLETVEKQFGQYSFPAADVLSALGQLYERHGQYDKAEEFYNRALKIKSGQATPANGKAKPRTDQAEVRKVKAHLATIKKERYSASLRKGQSTAPRNAPETSSEESPSSQPAKKRGVFKDIGHGLGKVFGIFGHHKRNPN